jgi:hypothetical protein
MRRHTAITVTICAAGLSLTACTAGITTASPTASPSHPAASPSHPASSSSSAAATVRVNAPIGSFPIPQGAQVAYNISCAKQIGLAVSPVTQSQSSTFYATALPRAGYKIESDITSNAGAAQGLTEIEFSGHGYTGTIITIANLGAAASAGSSSITLPSDMTKNVAEIIMSADGTPASYLCPA